MNRRELVTGLISLVAMPAIVRVGSLMPVRAVLVEPSPTAWIVFSTFADGRITGVTRKYEDQQRLARGSR